MDLITCLWFNGNAREAATFYTAHFPNSELSTNWLAPRILLATNRERK
jgi:predicted 3-demethylubiquinone-9 3-methyltransferase (glyoxalase superfamily)